MVTTVILLNMNDEKKEAKPQNVIGKPHPSNHSQHKPSIVVISKAKRFIK